MIEPRVIYTYNKRTSCPKHHEHNENVDNYAEGPDRKDTTVKEQDRELDKSQCRKRNQWTDVEDLSWFIRLAIRPARGTYFFEAYSLVRGHFGQRRSKAARDCSINECYTDTKTENLLNSLGSTEMECAYPYAAYKY